MDLPAEAAAVGPLLDEVLAWAQRVGLPPTAANNLALLAEELAANTVRHAAGATGFRLSARRTADKVVVVFSDDGPAFDPLAAELPDRSGPLEDRLPGGLGLRLIRRLTSRAEYSRENGRNRLDFILGPAA